MPADLFRPRHQSAPGRPKPPNREPPPKLAPTPPCAYCGGAQGVVPYGLHRNYTWLHPGCWEALRHATS